MNKSNINKICEIEFGEVPREIVKKTVGICNEVYEVKFEDDSYILRMNKDKDDIYGTHKFLPIFEKLNIKTPHIIAEDYSKKVLPFHYQILNKIEGEDLGVVIGDLSEQQLKSIAKDVSAIFDEFDSLGEVDTFGMMSGVNEERYNTLFEVIQSRRKVILERNENSKVINEKLVTILEKVIEDNEDYFLNVKSKMYHDDICSRNVMIHKGEFNGLVDLDSLAKGDYLDAIGSMMASWYGEKNGLIYTDEIVRLQKLSEEQRKMVKVYAILHLLFWLSEEGVKFNSNSTGVVNWDNVKEKEQKIVNLFNSLNN